MRRFLTVAALAAVVAALLLVSRCSGGTDNSAVPAAGPTSATAAAPSTPTADPTGPTSTAAPAGDGDDAAADTSDYPAVITAGPTEAKEAAIQAVVKLLNTQGKTPEAWRAGLRPYVSDDLYGQLADADPATVPVGQVNDSKVTVATAGDGLVQVQVPVIDPANTIVATIHVTLTGTSGRWVVTGLDVERS